MNVMIAALLLQDMGDYDDTLTSNNSKRAGMKEDKSEDLNCKLQDVK